MSPLSVPVVWRATSGAQSPLAGGRIVPHQMISAPKASAKATVAFPRLCVKSATAVPKPRMTKRPTATPLTQSAPGNRNHNAIADQALIGATSEWISEAK